MSSEHSEQEQSLRARVEQSERALDELQGQLRSIDANLAELARRNNQYAALESICHSLEELDAVGAGHLFWGQQTSADQRLAHLRHARQHVSNFGAEVARVEKGRRRLIDKINAQNDVLDYLHYDLRDAIEREESRRNEWLIEREISELPHRAQVMPWARGGEEDQRFRQSLGVSLAGSVAIALLVSTIAIPIVTRETVPELPERVAKLVRRERPPPPPPVLAEEPIVPEELPEPEPQVVEEPAPEPTDEPLLAMAEQADTREQTRSRGILAFRDSFASRANLRRTTRLGSQARLSNAGTDAVGRPERLMVTTSAPGSSGGINLADISRDVGGGGQGIEGVQVSRVASSIGGGGGDADRPMSSGGVSGRTDEEIQIVFDRYKASLYRLYNRELRRDPTLRGQLVLRLTIEPNGSVSLCQLYSSSMDAPALAQQVVERVRTFDFGAKEDIVAMTIIYPIDFLPAA